MSMMKKTMLAAVILAGAGLGVAHAGVSGSGISATADLVFSNVTNITNAITASSNLTAGKHSADDTIAIGSIRSLDGLAHAYAVKFSPDIDTSKGGMSIPSAVVKGKNDSSNQVTLALTGVIGESAVPKDGYLIVGQSSAANETVKYSIVMPAGQTVAADTYTVGTVAYTYTA
ncbi:hypothetical protein ACLEEB_02620 [Lonsdalea quercina]|uniref:hypothetical protein n=1 Tax=Lonsdalea quercina TaxID=71657 RepID=UPI003976C11E